MVLPVLLKMYIAMTIGATLQQKLRTIQFLAFALVGAYYQNE